MLPAATFDAREAAERIGLPPLAPDGEALLHSIHAQVVQIWEQNSLADIDLLVTLANDGAARAVNAYPGDPAVPMNCTSGQLVTALGVATGAPRALALKRAEFLAQYVLGSLISSVQADWPHSAAYPRRTVTSVVNGTMGAEKVPMPRAAKADAEFSVSCFMQNRGTAKGSIECGDESLQWEYSGGVLGLPRPGHAAALGLTTEWVRVAVAAAMSSSTSKLAA